MNNQPLISVLIPAFNCCDYISQAVESVWAQEYENLEIIVADDGSTDNTKQLFQSFITLEKLKNVKYFCKPNEGIAATHNFLLKKASGDFIAWCDADDFWLPCKLQAQVHYFEKKTDCEIVFYALQKFF